MTQPVQTPPTPRLPDAGPEYARTYFDGLLSTLRLYFNRLNNALSVLFGPLGGVSLETPYAMLMSNQDQGNPSTTGANLLTYNQPAFMRGVEVRNGGELWFTQPGQYLVTSTLQVTNRSNAAQVFEVWATYNGAVYPLSNTRFDIPARKSESEWSHIVPAITGIFTVNNPDTDFLAIRWWASSTLVFIEHYAAQTNPARPEIPSVILTVNAISRLPTQP